MMEDHARHTDRAPKRRKQPEEEPPGTAKLYPAYGSLGGEMDDDDDSTRTALEDSAAREKARKDKIRTSNED